MYNTPKVTIDLDEYNALHEKIKSLSKDHSQSEVDILKKVICRFFEIPGGVHEVLASLREDNIVVYFREGFALSDEERIKVEQFDPPSSYRKK